MKKGELIAELEKQLAKSNDDEGPVMEFCLDLARQLEEPKAVKVVIYKHPDGTWSWRMGDWAAKSVSYFLSREFAKEDAIKACSQLGLVAEIEEER